MRDRRRQGPALEVSVDLPLEHFTLRAEISGQSRNVGVFGPSGSGKTSLLECIAGLRRNAKGRIVFDGRVWLDSAQGLFTPPEERRIGYVPQDGLLFPHWSVERNLRAGEPRARRSGASFADLLDTAVDLLELSALLARPIDDLSGGERQRVSLARALCSGATLLLLDEPLASLDLPLRRRILPLLDRVRRELQVPMLVVSHDPTEMQALCDELYVLREGTVIASGEPRQVLTDPEVYPFAEETGLENSLPCIVTVSGEGETRVRLGADGSGPELHALRGGGRVGERSLVGIPSRDILLATEEPRGLSARNVFPARVAEVRVVGRTRLVSIELAAGVPRLVVELTEAARCELHLAPGARVYAVVKASACILYSRTGGGVR